MLYPTAMGAAFDSLPEPLRAFHAAGTDLTYTGEVTVSHGTALTRLMARAGGMPSRAGTMPFRFRVTRDGASETWTRDFNGHITRSSQWLHSPAVVAERVGGATFLMTPEARDGALVIPITGATAFGLPIPKGLLRSCEGIERVTPDGAITFDVHATLAGLGLLIRYAGTLRPV